MSYFYEMDLQFVKAGVPTMFDSKIKFDMETAKEMYNTESMLATNPKKILDGFPCDNRTYKMVLKSKNPLDNPTKAIRRFSTILAGKDYLAEYVTGKRLFKLTAREIPYYKDPDDELPAPSEPQYAGISKYDKEILSDIISVFYSPLKSDIAIKEELINLFQSLTETPF